MRHPFVVVIIATLAIALVALAIESARACDTPRPADCRVYEDTHTCISRLDERRREIARRTLRARS